MKKMVFLLLIVPLVYVGKAQVELLDSFHTYEVVGNTLTVYQTAAFPYGYGSTCPKLDPVFVQVHNAEITIDLFYDTRGPWPDAYCERHDIIGVTGSGEFTLVVNCNLIHIDSSITDSVVTLYDSDTTSNIVLSAFEVAAPTEIGVFPNPARDHLTVESRDGIKIRELILYNSVGQVVKEYDPRLRRLPVSGLPGGIYYLGMATDRGVITQEVVLLE